MDVKPRSFVEVLQNLLDQVPDRVIYRFADDAGRVTETLTVRELDRRARAIAVALRESCAPGDRVILLHGPGLDFVASLFGVFHAGGIAVPVPPRPARRRSSPGTLAQIARECTPAAVLCDARMAAQRERVIGESALLGRARWILAESAAEASGPESVPDVDADRVALLQFTSGSTTRPRGVVLTQGHLVRNSAAIQRALGHDRDSRAVVWLPPYHDMGLIGGILQPLYAGFPVLLLSPLSFVRRPALWLELVSRERASTSGGPNSAYELCVQRVAPEQVEKLDLRSWRIAFASAEPVSADTLRRFASAFAPAGFQARAFYPSYGLAEATLFVTGGSPGTGVVERRLDAEALRGGRAEPQNASCAEATSVVSCGTFAQDTRVVAVDAAGRKCPEGVVGALWVSGPGVARGYWNRPAETEATFGARLVGDEATPYLVTGDLGFLSGGELFVTGRSKELLIVSGRNHYPHDLEFTATRSHFALQSTAAAFAVPVEGREAVVIAIELRREAELARTAELVAAVRAAIAESHDLALHEVVLVRAGAIPRTSSGKIQRIACRDLYRAGTLAVLARDGRTPEPGSRDAGGALDSDVEELLRDLCAIWSSVLGVEAVDPDRSFFEMGGTSLMAPLLVQRIADRTGRPLSLVTLFQSPTARALALHLRGHAQPAPRDQIARRAALQKAARRRYAETLSPGRNRDVRRAR